jgi:hypothetical protein
MWDKEKSLRGRLNWEKINLKTIKKDVREKIDVNSNMLSIFLNAEKGKITGGGIRDRNLKRWTKVVL